MSGRLIHWEMYFFLYIVFEIKLEETLDSKYGNVSIFIFKWADEDQTYVFNFLITKPNLVV
jgi:hypothetical protein